MVTRSWLGVAALVGVLGCGSGTGPVDAGRTEVVDAGGEADAGIDAGVADAGVPDDAGPGGDAGFVADGGDGDAGRTALDAGFDAGRPAPPPLPDGGVRVRVIAANLTSGNLQTYDPGNGQRILQALGGDIIAIQEFNVGGNTAQGLRAFVDATFDGGFFFTRGSGRIPNGVISRYPIVDAGEWDDTRTTDREFVWARLDVPGPTDVWVVSLHLLSSTPLNRNNQSLQLRQLIADNVPPDVHLVLAGDLNTDTRDASVETCLTTLSAVVDTTGPWPTDGALTDGGNGNTSTNRSRPYDWVLVPPALRALEVPVVLGTQFFPTGLVFDTRVFTPLDEAPPAQALDSSSTNMQHMAVVRDFAFFP